jgi:putative transposase
MKEQGLIKQRRRRGKGQQANQPEAAPREMRSFEVRHVHGLWRADYHVGSRKVVSPSGVWQPPVLLGFLDDRSRLACHLQWYLTETTETFVHGLCQAARRQAKPVVGKSRCLFGVGSWRNPSGLCRTKPVRRREAREERGRGGS